MKILICDDQELVREGLEMLLNLDPDLDVVGTAENGKEAVEIAGKLMPDIVLMDLKMPVMNGIEATRAIRAAYPEIKVLVLTTYDHDEWLFDAIRAGASGYLLKDARREDIINAIKGTFESKTFIDPKVAGKVLKQAADRQIHIPSEITSKITKRELDVLRLIAKGFSNTEIARKLHLSEGTIRNHVSAIFTKLQVNDRTQAAILAIHHGLDH
jgi:DNA-binding NarL/FixJ family response regulator